MGRDCTSHKPCTPAKVRNFGKPLKLMVKLKNYGRTKKHEPPQVNGAAHVVYVPIQYRPMAIGLFMERQFSLLQFLRWCGMALRPIAF